MILVSFIALQVYDDDAIEDALKTPPTVEMGFSRFIAAMVMHIILNDEIFNGLKMIKYSTNHTWKFSHPKVAFTAGFL